MRTITKSRGAFGEVETTMSDQKLSVIDEIRAERERQTTHENWSLYHDNRHTRGTIARAAAWYAMPESWRQKFPKLWPSSWRCKPKDRRRDLIRAAALIVAEIERLDRKEPRL